MATDVARLSFDPTRHYTGVVQQQGRVSLEAEQNEQRTIDAEERRRDLLDVVGPAGTPDNGYAVSSPAADTLAVGPGTMYVGGLRVELDGTVDVLQRQPDWLDRPTGVFLGGRNHVVLTLTECDVTAVEDQALYEVALGGPDGAARTRLLQHLEVRPVAQDATCATALLEDEQDWAALGLDLEPATLRLHSRSRLLAGFQTPAGASDPCQPAASGGYLGAENQLLRVQITRVDREARTVDLVWGYDDASMLYAVSLLPQSADLQLDRSPVDTYHWPRTGQAVQLLPATAQLTARDGQIEGYVAGLDGPVTDLLAPYDPDTNTVTWPATMPSQFMDPEQTPRLYLRVWEEQLTGQKLGTPIDLAGTGVQVTFTADGDGPPHVGDFWCLGVRPSTPTEVYPARLLRAPQPPDGPRQWVCPLAVVDRTENGMTVVEDCRHHFPPLVDVGGGCCTLEVTPADAAAGRLQALLDSAAAGRLLDDRAARITVCFAPGHYELPVPIVLTGMHSRMSLKGCSGAAVLSAQVGKEGAFDQGLIVLTETDDVTIAGFELRLPLVANAQPPVRGFTGGVFGRNAVRAVNALAASSYVSIGIRPTDCTNLEISDCLFQFAVGGDGQPDVDPGADVTGVGIFPAGSVQGTQVRRNVFRHDPLSPLPQGGPRRILIGYFGTASTLLGMTGAVGAGVQQNFLDDVELSNNEFSGLAAAAVVSGQFGSFRVRDNRVRDVYAGFFLEDFAAVANLNLAGSFDATGADTAAVTAIGQSLADALADPVLLALTAFGATYPTPASRPGSPGQIHLDPAALPQLRADAEIERQASTARLVERIAAEHPAGDAASAGAQEVVLRPARERPGVDAGLLAVREALLELVRLAAAETPAPTTGSAVQFRGNDVECQLPDSTQTVNALLLFGRRPETATPSSTAVFSDNRLVAPLSDSTVTISGYDEVTITGNICNAADSDATSPLTVAGVSRVAITGNVLYKFPRLPQRPFPAPLDSWLPLNTPF